MLRLQSLPLFSTEDPMTKFSERFPPINRVTNDLDVVSIDVQQAGGVTRYDPNRLIMAYFDGALAQLEPIPGVVSVISQKPAVTYTSTEVQIPLTPEELRRLVSRQLKPAEFFALAFQYGVFFEIHEDFYNEETGIALQPADANTSVSIRVSKTGDWVEVVGNNGAVLHSGHHVTPDDLAAILNQFGITAEVERDYDFE